MLLFFSFVFFVFIFFFFNDTATTEIYTLSLHDALPIRQHPRRFVPQRFHVVPPQAGTTGSCSSGTHWRRSSVPAFHGWASRVLLDPGARSSPPAARRQIDDRELMTAIALPGDRQPGVHHDAAVCGVFVARDRRRAYGQLPRPVTRTAPRRLGYTLDGYRRRHGGRRVEAGAPPPDLYSGIGASVQRSVVDPRFAATLRQLRADRGLSLRDLARRAVYGKSYLHELETGSKQPSMEVAERLDVALQAGGQLTGLVHAAGESPRIDDGEVEALELARRVATSDVSAETLDRLELAADELAVAYARVP